VHGKFFERASPGIVARGPRAVVSLAFAIAAARIYPTVKYAMGHGQSCSRVLVAGAPAALSRPVATAAVRHA